MGRRRTGEWAFGLVAMVPVLLLGVGWLWHWTERAPREGVQSELTDARRRVLTGESPIATYGSPETPLHVRAVNTGGTVTLYSNFFQDAPPCEGFQNSADVEIVHLHTGTDASPPAVELTLWVDLGVSINPVDPQLFLDTYNAGIKTNWQPWDVPPESLALLVRCKATGQTVWDGELARESYWIEPFDPRLATDE